MASCMLNLHQLAPPPCRHTLEPPTEHLHPHRVRAQRHPPCPVPPVQKCPLKKESCHLLDPLSSGGCNPSSQLSAGNIHRGATEYSSCIWAPSFWQEVMAESGRRKHTYQIVQWCHNEERLKISLGLLLVEKGSEYSWPFQTDYISMCLTMAHHIHWLIKHTVSLATEHTGQLSTGREFYLTLKRNSFLKSLTLPNKISNSKDPNDVKVSLFSPRWACIISPFCILFAWAWLTELDEMEIEQWCKLKKQLVTVDIPPNLFQNADLLSKWEQTQGKAGWRKKKKNAAIAKRMWGRWSIYKRECSCLEEKNFWLAKQVLDQFLRYFPFIPLPKHEARLITVTLSP